MRVSLWWWLRWFRNGKAIVGANATSYVANAADSGRSRSCRVTATNSGAITAATSAAVRVTG